MKWILLLATLFTLSTSQLHCNEQERKILNEVARIGCDLIYAIDETMSSMRALDTMFEHLNYSFRDAQIPFVFDSRLLEDMEITPVEAPGFCELRNPYDRIFGYVSKNETMFGVFYGCNLYNLCVKASTLS